MAEPGAQDFATSLKKGSQKWESLEGTRGAGRTTIPACVSGTTGFSSAPTKSLLPSLLPKSYCSCAVTPNAT